MQVEPSIFKAYDIRGTYPAQIDATVAYSVGRAYGTLLSNREHGRTMHVVVGSDMRLSSPELKKDLTQGILDSGLNADDIGLISTPTFYFGVAYFGYDGGIMVSASHNPKEWNGFKLASKRALPISKDNGIVEMQRMIEREQFISLASGKEIGTLRNKNGIVETAVREQLKDLSAGKNAIKPFKIAFDGGSGMGGADMKQLFSVLPCKIAWMNEIPDGTFPAHPADPMVPENTEALRKEIVDGHCDLGIASDGDGDRYFFFDEKGEVVPAEILRGIMAQIELRKNPGATVVYDVRPGKITKDMIEEAGGKPILAPVGHSLIKAKMIEEKAIFGGESSGHYFYKLPYGTFEAPIVLVYKFLTFLSEQNKPLSEIIAPYKRYFNSGEINTHLENREAGSQKIEKIAEKFKDCKQSLLDGLTVESEDYWFNVRLSNTEPLIRFIVEARTKALMEEKRREILVLVKEK